MRQAVTIAMKDLKILLRDRFAVFWVVVFPLLMALFFGSIFSSGNSGQGQIDIGVVTDTSSAFARDLVKELRASPSLTVHSSTLDSARAHVGAGDLTAYVYVADTADTAESSLGFFNGRMPAIEIGIDPARKAEAGFLEGLVTQAYFTVLQRQMMNPQVWHQSVHKQLGRIQTDTTIPGNVRDILGGFLIKLDTLVSTLDTSGIGDSAGIAAHSPFGAPDIKTVAITETRKWPKSGWEITFPQALQWALIGCAAAFALSLVTERTRGTLIRLRLAPLSQAHIIGGKGLACFIACLVVTGALISLGVVVFGVRVQSATLLALALLCASFCFVGIMMFISVLGKTEQSVGGAGWAIMLVMSMTGGGMIPLMFMPRWMSAVGTISPVKWSILAMEGAIWRGFTFSQMLLPLAVLVGFGIAGFTSGILIMRRFR